MPVPEISTAIANRISTPFCSEKRSSRAEATGLPIMPPTPAEAAEMPMTVPAFSRIHWLIT